MNLHLTPEQFIVLYELIISASLTSNKNEDYLNCLAQIKEKLSSIMQKKLESDYKFQQKEKLSVWVKNEEKKINQLSEDLLDLKKNKNFTYQQIDDGLYARPEK